MEDDLYGDVPGSKPEWFRATFRHGKRRTESTVPSELGSVGLTNWYGGPAQDTSFLPSKRIYPEKHAPSGTIQGPVVVGGNVPYLRRRSAAPGTEALEYRRSIKFIPEPEQPLRPEGKRCIPPPVPKTKGHFLDDATTPPPPVDPAARPKSDYMREPNLPIYGRPRGISCLRETTDQEVSFERSVGRKVKCTRDGFYGQGRAGDMSVRFGVKGRAEDERRYFQQLKDSPTFMRFCNSLQAPALVSPHARRAAADERTQKARIEAERALVRQLHWDAPDE